MKIYVKNILLLFLTLIIFTSCANKITLKSENKFAVLKLKNDILFLSDKVKEDEAKQLSEIFIYHSHFLALRYNINSSAYWHNILVNAKIKKRGLCYHYVKDLIKELQKNTYDNVDIYWMVHKKNTYLEHNVLLLTAKNQSLSTGIVLDPWRYTGKLYWSSIQEDQKYKWSEDIKRSKAYNLVHKYNF